MLRRLVVMACLAYPTSGARADVIVVDPHGGPGAVLLESALAAAVDGDILVLRAGNYETGHKLPYDIVGKSLTLVGESVGSQIRLPGLRVSGTAAGQPVIVRGLHLRRTTAPLAGDMPASLAVLECADVVWIEDCHIEGRDEVDPGFGVDASSAVGLFIGLSADVIVTRCTISGGDGRDDDVDGFGSTDGANGVFAGSSRFTVLDSSVAGGDGGDGAPGPSDPHHGGAALYLSEADAIGSGCQLAGGDDGVGTTANHAAGPGIQGFGDSHVWLRDSTVVAGAAQDGEPPTPDIILPPDSVFLFPAAARNLSVGGPVAEGQSATLAVGGVQGDGVWLLASLTPAYAPVFGKQGVLSLSVPLVIVPLTAAIGDPGGQLALPFTMPTLPGGLNGLVFELQALHFGADGTTLGAPTCLVWISDTL